MHYNPEAYTGCGMTAEEIKLFRQLDYLEANNMYNTVKFKEVLKRLDEIVIRKQKTA